MKIFFSLVTPDGAVRRHFATGKDAVVPVDATTRGFFQRRKAEIRLGAWSPDVNEVSEASFERFLLNRLDDAEACVVLVDGNWRNVVRNIRNSAFVVTFDIQRAQKNPRNFFYSLIAKVLRSFGQLLAKFEPGDDGKLLTLPLRNFHADELREIARLCREQYDFPTFGSEVETELAKLRKRVRPRKKSQYRTRYAIDDRLCFFDYGNERHARFATGDNHLPSCELAGKLRFGRRIDEQRHYNVSQTEGDTTVIHGDFPDCHDHIHTVADRTHLNMFANDYF